MSRTPPAVPHPRVHPVMAALLALGAPLALGASPAAAQDPGGLDPVAGAVLAAPPELREGATVLGAGEAARPGDVLATLREGTNTLVCLADDPGQEGFRVACYHESLDPFMALGRRLRAEGADREGILESRFAALEAGEISMPPVAALYAFSADEMPDPARPDEAAGARRRTVVYVPFATLDDTGLPSRPVDGGPWLMLPETPWAHIMIDG